MGNIMKIFNLGFRQVLRDGMLLMLIPAPFLMGIALKLLVPFAEEIVMKELGFSISPWYPISDSLLIVMTPVMTAMVCAFIILYERDEGIGVYYFVTPSGGMAYLISRILLPMVWAFTSTLLVLGLFSLSIESFLVMVLSAFAGTMQGGLCRARHNPPYVELDIMPSYCSKPVKHQWSMYFNSA